MKRIALIFSVYFLSLGATLGVLFHFNSPVDAQPQAVAQVDAPPFATLDPHATATPTPFQPPGPTRTPPATPTPLPPTPTFTPTLPDYPMPEGRVNILLLGTDQRADAGFRTDVIMLVSIDARQGSVSVISFPRDLYVNIPGWGQNRINTAFAHGGFPGIASTFQANFNVQPQYYFLTNMHVIVEMIDSLNGITVNASESLTDKCDLPQASYGYCTVEPGAVRMDGPTALWYVRSRKSSSDFDRTRRAQEVLYGVFTRMMKFDAATHLPELYEQYQSSVETNMALTDMLPLLPAARQILQDPSRIRRYSVTPSMVSNYVTSGGAMVLLPNYTAIYGMIGEALSGE